MGASSAASITYRRVVDLTHPIRPGIPLWPGDPPVRFESVATIAGRGYHLRRLSMGEHSGTHLATPSALYDGGAGPDDLSPGSLVAPAVVIDVSGLASRNSDYTLTVSDLADWERRNGPVPMGSWALLYTGWQRYWDEPERFINADGDGMMRTPGFGVNAARFVLEQRGAVGLGIDTHGIDAGADAELSVSHLALGRGALALECLNNLDRLPAAGSTIVVGRLPLAGGSGSPAAVLALAP